MSVASITWPDWLPKVLWFRRRCPRCTSIDFKPAELRPYDGLLALFFLHPVRCKSCWRRFYWIALRAPE
jgi:hypothetical protein